MMPGKLKWIPKCIIIYNLFCATGCGKSKVGAAPLSTINTKYDDQY